MTRTLADEFYAEHRGKPFYQVHKLLVECNILKFDLLIFKKTKINIHENLVPTPKDYSYELQINHQICIILNLIFFS